MTKNYKILTSYVKDISSKISGTENFIYLKDNIPKYSLGIDINSLPLKNNMAEVNIRLTFDNKNEKDKKAYFEMTHTTVVRVEESAVNKNELKNRLIKRNQNSDEELEKRFNAFDEDIKHWNDYDYIIINKNLDVCFKQIENIINLNKKISIGSRIIQ